MDVTNVNLQALNGMAGNANNLATFSEELANLLLISQNRWKWADVQKRITPFWLLSRTIEMYLCFYGQCALVRKYNHIRVMMCTGVGNTTFFGVPSRFEVRDYNGGNVEIYDYNSPDFVWIRNNDYLLPTTFWLYKFADRIAKARRVMDLNIDAQKTPYIISTTPNKLLTVKNIFKQIRDMWEAVIMDERKGIADSIKVMNLNAPFVADKLSDLMDKEYNKALNFLGIRTIDEKAERLITAEGDISKEITRNNVSFFERPRQEACEEVRTKFGIELTIDFIGEEIANNGKLYNTSETSD